MLRVSRPAAGRCTEVTAFLRTDAHGHMPERLPVCFCNTTEKVLFFYIKGAGGLYSTEDFPDPVSCSGQNPLWRTVEDREWS